MISEYACSLHFISTLDHIQTIFIQENHSVKSVAALFLINELHIDKFFKTMNVYLGYLISLFFLGWGVAF